MTRVPKAKFKPKAFEYFRLVEETGEELIITDHGKAVLKLSRTMDEDETLLMELRGSVKEYSHPLIPVGTEDWDLLQ